jgi:hypothetical protein
MAPRAIDTHLRTGPNGESVTKLQLFQIGTLIQLIASVEAGKKKFKYASEDTW